MGTTCCYTNRLIFNDDDDDLAKSITIEVISMKASEEISTKESLFNNINHKIKLSSVSSFSSQSI